MKKYDTIIVGAGPGGLTAGKLLAEAGINTLVIDKLKHEKIGDKTCGGGVPRHTMALIPESLIENKTDKIKLSINDHHINIEGIVLGYVSRQELGQWQLKIAEEAGCEILDDTRVKSVDLQNCSVKLSNNSELSFKHLVGADGSNSIVRRSLGFNDGTKAVAVEYRVEDPSLTECEIFFDYKKLGATYCWIFPHGKYASVGTGCYPSMTNMKLVEREFKKIMNEKGVQLDELERRAAPLYATYHGFSHLNNKVFLVGDAASFLCTLDGEGIYQSIKSGELAARAILGDKNYKKELAKLELFNKRGQLLINDSVARSVSRIINNFGGFINSLVGSVFDMIENSPNTKQFFSTYIFNSLKKFLVGS